MKYACGECGKPIKTGCYCAECADRESQADKEAELAKEIAHSEMDGDQYIATLDNGRAWPKADNE